MRRLLWNSFSQLGFFNKPSISSFASDVLKLVGGTAIAQALVILASPIVTRIYGPEAFGLSAIFASITGIIAVVACLRYELAIMLPEKDDAAANLLWLSLLIAAIMSVLLIPVLWLIQEALLQLLNASEIAPYIWMVPLSVFLSGSFMALNYWNSRTRRFGRLSLVRIIASINSTGVQLGAGLTGFPTGGSLIGAGVLGSAVSTLQLGLMIWRDDHKILWENIDLEVMWEGLKRYKRFLVFDTWSALLNSLSSQLPILILARFFNTTVIGYYTLGFMVLAFPMSLISSSVGQVFFNRAVKARIEGNLGTLVEKIVLNLVIISIYPFFLLSLFGEEFFSTVFGTHWGEAGLYAQILVPWVFIVFATSPISTLFSILEKQSNSLLVNIFLVVFRAASLILGGILNNVLIGLILFSLVGCFVNIIVLFWLMNKSGASIIHLFVSLISSLKYCIPLILFTCLIKVFVTSPEHIVFICVINAIIYYLIIFKGKTGVLSYN